MNSYQELTHAFSDEQWKKFLFAVGSDLYRDLKRRTSRHYLDKLYEVAREHAGCRSLVFPPRAGTVKEQRREDDLTRSVRLLLYGSLYNAIKSHGYLYDWRVIYLTVKQVIHEGRLLMHAEDVTYKFVPAPLYSLDSLGLARRYYDQGRSEDLAILCDALEDDGDHAASLHLRSGLHTPICPVIQHLVKEKR